MRILIAAMFLFLGACSGGEDVAKAERSIYSFHAALNAGNFQAIHDRTGAEWKRATTEADAIKLFSAVRTKLGPFNSGKQTGWRVNYGTGGKTIVVQYESRFERGPAIEIFTFRDAGETAQMVGYNVNSRLLLPL